MALLSRVLLAGLALAVVGASMVKPKRRFSLRSGPVYLDGDRLTVGDGNILPAMRWPAKTGPHGVILSLHAYGDYRRSFRLVGPWFASHGFEVIAYDQRGFGETDSRGKWPGADPLIQDFGDAVAAIGAALPGVPIYVLGESMGAAVALSGLASGEVTGVERLIVAAPGVRGDMPLGQLHDSVLRLASLALPWLAIDLRRGGRPWLDPSEAARLADDPLVLRELSVGTYEGLVDLATMASDAVRGALPPTLLLYGELDGTIPRRAVDDLAHALNGERDDVRYYEDRHHMLLHEADIEPLLQDCLNWLNVDSNNKKN